MEGDAALDPHTGTVLVLLTGAVSLSFLGYQLARHTSVATRKIVGAGAIITGIIALQSILTNGSVGISIIDYGALMLYEHYGILGAMVAATTLVCCVLARISGHHTIRRYSHLFMFGLIFVNVFTFGMPLISRFSSNESLNMFVALGISYVVWRQGGYYGMADVLQDIF